MEVFLKDISKIAAGNSAPKKDEFSKEGTPFVRAGSLAFLTKGESLDKCEKVTCDTALKKRLKLFKKGSILFAKSGMSSKMGRIYQLEEDAYVVSHLAIIEVNNSVANPSYIKYFFILKPPFFLIRDDAYPSIKLEDIKNITLNLPDLKTQNKIVAFLDKASDLVQKREKSIYLLDELLKAQFLEMFGDPVLNTKEWETQKLSDVGSFKNGLNYTQNEKGAEVLCLGVGDFKNKSVITDNDSFTLLKLTKKPNEDFYLNYGDIVFVRSNGNKELVGRSVVILTKEKRVSFSGFCIRYRIEENILTSQFVNQVCKVPTFKRKMLQNGRGANIQNINQKILGNLEVPTPPIELQNQFETIYHNIQSQKETLIQSKTELEHLYNSLLQEAFREVIEVSKEEVKKKDSIMPEIKKKDGEKVDITNLDLATFLGIPDEITSTREKWMFDLISLDEFYQFLLKDNFKKEEFFTLQDIEEKLWRDYYHDGDMDFDNAKWQQIIFKFLEAKPPLLEQIFDKETATVKLKLTDETFKA